MWGSTTSRTGDSNQLHSSSTLLHSLLLVPQPWQCPRRCRRRRLHDPPAARRRSAATGVPKKASEGAAGATNPLQVLTGALHRQVVAVVAAVAAASRTAPSA